MTGAALLGLAAAVLALAAVRELRASVRERGEGGRGPGAAPSGPAPVGGIAAGVAERLALRPRIARAGLAGRLELRGLLAAKLAGALAGAAAAAVAAPAAPGRFAVLVVVGLPVAGFMGPDAALERRARARTRALRASLPDALDLVATATAAGRSPLAGLAEISTGKGTLARELAVVVAESDCGVPQRRALANLRTRVPAQELAAMSALIERSRRYGSPLAEQLHDQASALRGAQRRRIEEEAARAAPKIQLAVALLLVPSVLLMIAAGLLANLDRFLAGI